MDENAGEVLVVCDPSRSCIEVHIRSLAPDDYRMVRLSRHEARRLAALILFQAERVDGARRRPGLEHEEPGAKTA